MHMKALVTGNLGFVGSYFTERLREAGWQVGGMDIKRGPEEDCRRFFAKSKWVIPQYDLVVHAAAIVGGRGMIDSLPLVVAQDFGIDAAMFEWAVRTEQPRVLYFSSSAAYPTAYQQRYQSEPLSEGFIDLCRPQQPDMSYGWTKVMGEILAGYARQAGVRVHVVRPFSGYGATQDLDYPFPSFIDRAVRRADPFEIWGDGEQERDFIHISDIYGACMAMIEDNLPGPYNLGTGMATSFNTLASMVCEVAGYSPEVKHRLAAPVGVHSRVASMDQLNTVYTPKVSLEEGIEEALHILKK